MILYRNMQKFKEDNAMKKSIKLFDGNSFNRYQYFICWYR